MLSPLRLRLTDAAGGMMPALGWLLIGATLLAIQVALGLVFDPRYKDFPFAPLTPAILPLLTLSFAAPVRGRSRGAAETIAATTLALSAVYIFFNETAANWQSVWLCALMLALAVTLFRTKGAAVPG
jgi:glucan 1,3-beta-glucosidase